MCNFESMIWRLIIAGYSLCYFCIIQQQDYLSFFKIRIVVFNLFWNVNLFCSRIFGAVSSLFNSALKPLLVYTIYIHFCHLVKYILNSYPICLWELQILIFFFFCMTAGFTSWVLDYLMYKMPKTVKNVIGDVFKLRKTAFCTYFL